MNRKVFTCILMLIFFWTWPVRLFTKKNNCYFWTLEKLIKYGGRAEWYPSKRWKGYHVVWVRPDGTKVEYTLPKMKKDTPWWQMLFYDGKVRKFKSLRRDQ